MKSESANLNLLRAIAVLCVIISHGIQLGGPFSKSSVDNIGTAGVLLFFVHTSLVLQMSLERQSGKLGTDFLWSRFMVRRVFRIFPLSIVTVLVTVAFALPGTSFFYGSMALVELSPVDFVSNLLLTQNLTFSPSSPAPLWSLPYEIQMYCLLPALFLLAIRVRRFAVMFSLWLLAVGLAVFYLTLGHNLRGIERLDVLLYAPCFIPGILAFYLLRSHRRSLPAALWPVVILAAVAIYNLFPKNVWGATWVFCLLTGIAIPLFAEVKNPIVNRCSHLIAKYSYGIYLGHVACMWLAFVVLRDHSLLFKWAVFASTMTPLTYLLYTYIEEPMVKVGGLVANRIGAKLAIALAAAAD